MADDVIDLIKHQHRQLETLLDEADGESPETASIVRQIRDILVPHSEAEEDFVYPTIRQKASETGDEVKDGTVEHHHIEGMLKDLLAQKPGDPGYDGTLAAMAGELRHHIEEEEEELLPALADHSSVEELERLGQRFADATGTAPNAADGSGGGDGEGGGSSSSEPTRDELYQQAKEQDVPGRSQMSKEELADAVDDE